MIILNCSMCKVKFTTYECRIKRNEQIRKGKMYCSVKCMRLGRRNRDYIKCKICNKDFEFKKCRLNAGKVLYCSKKCYGIDNRGKNNYLYKEDASYLSKHRSIYTEMGKANHCEHCGLDKIPEGKKRYFQWANISRKYLRDPKDYMQLCVKCHRGFDGYGKNIWNL